MMQPCFLFTLALFVQFAQFRLFAQSIRYEGVGRKVEGAKGEKKKQDWRERKRKGKFEYLFFRR
jgi:hypothetical protein